MSKIYISSSELSESLMKFQEKRLEKLSSDDMIGHEFSKKFEAKMQMLIRRERKPYYPFIKTRVRVAVVVAVIVFLLMTTTVFALEPLRNKVFEFLINIFDEFSIVTIDDTAYDDAEAVPVSILDQYKPSYIPEGYYFSEENKTEDIVYIYYVHESPFDEISLTQSTKQSFTPTIDTEGVATTEIGLSNGMKGFYCTNKGVNIMVLHNADYAFMISSQIKLDELIKFAESLKAEK